MKTYSLTVRNRVGAAVLALAVLGAGAALLVVGFALLAALAVAGGVLGAGFAIYHRLRGTSDARLRRGSAASLGARTTGSAGYIGDGRATLGPVIEAPPDDEQA